MTSYNDMLSMVINAYYGARAYQTVNNSTMDRVFLAMKRRGWERFLPFAAAPLVVVGPEAYTVNTPEARVK
jgi:hypothetical protein